MGIPTAVHATHSFEKLLKMEAKASGMPDLGVWITPHPVAGKSVQLLREEVEKAIDDIINALTRPREKKGREGTKGIKTIMFEGENFFEAFERFNRYCLQERWGDGLPLVPPIREKVMWMLSGTDRPPEDNVVTVRPSGRIATVETVAINAVMAGALPAYMPIIITALEAWDECPFGWGSVTTTSPAAPMIIIKGPITRQLDINSKSNAAGYGWRANATIGRTVELIFKTVGGAIPGITDMAIAGDARTITSTVVAENEDVLNNIGWPTYAESQGFHKDANVLTIGPAFWGYEEIWIKADTAEELLRCLVWEVSPKVREGIMGWGGGLFLLMAPEHAKILAQGGWTKEKVTKYLASVLPKKWCFPKWQLRDVYKAAYPRAPQDLKELPDDIFITGYSSDPKDYLIFVVGGAGNESQSWRVWRWTPPYDPGFVNKEIRLPKNWDKIVEESQIQIMPMPKLPW
jgi:hypothetical protein